MRAKKLYLKTVVHVHTNYSYDSNLSPRELIASAKREQIDCVAVTDHNEIAGAWDAREASDGVRVIIGEEVSTREGHLIGLFLERLIPPGLSALETAQRIRDQGGLVLVPHAFASMCRHYLGPVIEEILPWIDAIEVCNAQNPLFWQDRKAERFATKHEVIPFVGSDAHLQGRQIGPCYQWIPIFEDAPGFLDALRQAELCPGRYGPRYLMAMAGRHLWDHLTGRRWRGFGANASADIKLGPETDDTSVVVSAPHK